MFTRKPNISSKFKELVEHLEEMVERDSALHHHKNPFIQRINTLTSDDVKKIVQEYSQFSNESIHMLMDARVRVHEWDKLAKEVDRNIEEEKGLETQGVPHLEIMRKGYQAEFGFDVNSHEPLAITVEMIAELKKVFRTKNNAFLAGALLAFESISIPEFHILDSLVLLYEKQTGTYRNWELGRYIDGHKLFEIGHKDGLMHAIDGRIETGLDRAEFISGYLQVCISVSNWWKNLNSHLEKS